MPPGKSGYGQALADMGILFLNNIRSYDLTFSNKRAGVQVVYIFYSVFTLIYGLMNWLVFRQAAWALHMTGWVRTVLWIWCLVMAFSPAVSSLLGQRSDFWSWVTYVWFGLIFYLFLGALIVLILRLAIKPLGGGEAIVRGCYILLLVLAPAACAWGVFHARQVVVTELAVPEENLSSRENNLSIAVISDVHLHSVEAENRLERIIQKLEPLEYDLLLSLGDMIEPGIQDRNWETITALFDRLKPRLGKYAINGNHEAYANMAAGKDVSAEFHQACGFTLLVDQGVDVGGLIRLVGINDHGHDASPADREIDLLEKREADLPVLLLKHQPQVNKESIGHFDLMLSGHTHNGQIWPFNYMVKAVFPHIAGEYQLGPRSRLYVTPGTGTWGPPMRIGTTPEITLIHLVNPAGGAVSRHRD